MRQCAICHKGSRMGGTRRLLRGHYNPVNWSRKYPNLQYAKVDGRRELICTNCMKNLAKKPHARIKAAMSRATTAVVTVK